MALPVRKQIRLPDYNYSSVGAYCITICTKNKQHYFWGNVGERIALPQNKYYFLSEYGLIVKNAIESISVHYPYVSVDKYAIMPNHIHMIVVLHDGSAMRSPTVSTIVNQMKGYVTKQIGFSLWQKSFVDHIIRGPEDYNAEWKYIDENPLKWLLENDKK